MTRTIGILSAGAISFAVLLTGQPASAQWPQRAVSVNGQWLGPADLAVADQAVGFELPDGFYWYDARTCTWGLQGDQRPRGRLPCGGNQAPGGGGRLSPFTPPTCDAQGCFFPDYDR
jgi:hypothetical protein